MINGPIASNFRAFYKASKELYSKIDRANYVNTFDEVVVFVVNASFACEIGLKTILSKEAKKEFKEHNLHDLFNKLSNSSKQQIINNMSSLKDKSINSSEFYNYLSVVADNFPRVRYWYEHGIKTNWLFLYELMESIGTIIGGEK